MAMVNNLSFKCDAEQGQIHSLLNQLTYTEWLNHPCSLFEVQGGAGLVAKLDVSSSKEGEILLKLVITNVTKHSLEVEVDFPTLKGLRPKRQNGDVGYCFPMAIPIINQEPVDLCCPYGSNFPLQFMSVFHPEGGCVTLITNDTSNLQKNYRLMKSKQGKVDISVRYPQRIINPGEEWKLPSASLIVHEGDWREGFEAYRQRLRSWYRPTLPRKDWLLNSYHFRRHFLHPNLGDPCWNPRTGRYRLLEFVCKDINQLGGVDFVQLFDWAYEPNHGRAGDYSPWDYLGGWEEFNHEIQRVRQNNVHVGLYFEGYFLDKRAEVSKQYGMKWTVKNKDLQPYYLMGDKHWVPCSYAKEWQEYLKEACKGACDKVDVDGIYVDQYGYGIQYPCFDEEHGHPTPANQIQGENLVTSILQSVLTDDKVLITEYFPTDVSTQFQDGSLTDAKGIINLSRFAIPDFKSFVVIACDEPIGDNVNAIKRIFFNGQGLWIDGPIQDPKWFPEETKRLIRKTYSILKTYSQAFSCRNPKPLVNTMHPWLLANKFSAHSYNLWTLYNDGFASLDGELLEVNHVAGASYKDVWNGGEVKFRECKNKAFLDFSIAPSDVGCIIQLLP